MRYVLEADRRTGKMAAQRIARLPKGTLPKRAPPVEVRSPDPDPNPNPNQVSGRNIEPEEYEHALSTRPMAH